MPMRTLVRCVSVLVSVRCVSALSPPYVSAREVAAHLWTTRDLFETSVHGVIKCHEDLGPPAHRLAYMPCRNRGEILRLMLEEARVSYEVEVVGFRAWRDGGVKASTPHGKLPCLRDFDKRGGDLCQEGAVTRFLAEELGLAGRDAAEKAAVDQLYCLWFATLRNQGISHDGPEYSVAALKALDAVPDVPPYASVLRQNSLSRAERSLMALRYFEDAIRPSGFLLDDLTYPDLGLFYILYELGEDDNVPDWGERFGLPKLAKFCDAVAARPQIADYLASPRRMPRYARGESGASTYLYVAGRNSPEILL